MNNSESFSGRVHRNPHLLRTVVYGMSIILGGVFPAAHGATITSGPVVSIVKNAAGFYAGTAGDGVFLSADSGKTWTAMNNGLTETTIYQLFAASNGTLYVRTGAGLFGSTDNAQNWSGLDTSTDAPLGLGFFTVSSTGDVFSVGTAGLYKSTTSGTSWTLVKSGFGTLTMVGLVISGYYPMVYAGPAGSIYTTGFAGGLYRSTDGATWTMVDSLKNGSPAFVVAGAGTEAFFATSDKAGVYHSADNGLTWKKTSIGLLTTKVFGIVSNSAGDALAATDNGVYRMVKNGDEWRKTNTSLADTTVNAVAVTTGYVLAGTTYGDVVRMADAFNPPSDPALVRYDSLPGYTFLTSFKIPSGPFLLGTDHGAFRSSDTGKTWYRLPNGMGSDTTSVTGFAYAGTCLYAVAYGSLYRSLDNGNRWVSLQRSVDAQGVAGGTGGRIVTSSSTSDGFAYSDDNGITWVKTYSESLNKAFASNSSGTMYALGSTVYRSTNNGSSWTQTCSNPFAGYVSTGQITTDGAVVVTTPSGIYWSADNGATFALRGSGLSGFVGTNDGVIAVNALSDVFTLVSGHLYRMSSGDTTWKQLDQGPFSFLTQGDDGTAFTIDRAGKLALATHVSPHSGSWYLCDTLASIKTWGFAVAASGTVFAATDSGLYKSTDKGNSWARVPVVAATPKLRVDDVIVLPSGTVIVNLASGFIGAAVYRSTNEGTSWTNVSGVFGTGHMDYEPTKFVLGPSGTIYAPALLGIALYRSTDDGATWTVLDPTKHGVVGTSLSFNLTASSGGVFVASDSGIYKSTDNGASWSRAGKLTDHFIGSSIGAEIAGSSLSPVLFAAADSGIYRSADNGATWTNINKTLTYMSDIFVSSQGYVFAEKFGLQNQDSAVGLFYSADKGATWNCLTKELDDQNVANATCGPKGEVYAAFGNISGGKAWRYVGTLLPSGVTKYSVKKSLISASAWVSQNPLRGIVWISYGVLDPGANISIRVYDAVGHLVRTLINERQSCGEYRLAWDTRNGRGQKVISGVYYCRIAQAGKVSNLRMILMR